MWRRHPKSVYLLDEQFGIRYSTALDFINGFLNDSLHKNNGLRGDTIIANYVVIEIT